jgi:hypothetical protein
MTAIKVVTDGIIRNIRKKDIYIMKPSDQDRPSRTILCPPNIDISLDAQDFFLIENELIRLDRAKYILIIQYPTYTAPAPSVIIYQDTPPSDTNLIWINSVTGDHYVYDHSTNMWRSLNPEIIPFIRNFSQGTPLYPYGAQTSAPIYVNASPNRNYMVYRVFAYVNDRTATPNTHKVTLISAGYPDEELSLVNGMSLELFPTTRIIHPEETLEVRHSPTLPAYYISLTFELSELISP